MLLGTKNVFLSFIRNYQVTVLGAGKEVGQSISLLLRSQPSITKLVLHDTVIEMPGVVLDISHVPSGSTVAGYCGGHSLDSAIAKSDIVILAGGDILQPGLTKEFCNCTNAAFIRTAAARIARLETMPFVGVVTEPINSTVPMTAEVMRNHGVFDGNKLFGITTIDLLRAQCCFALENNLPASHCFLPVIGGHSSKTAVPLLSQAYPHRCMDESTIKKITVSLRTGSRDIRNAKKGWSPIISVAYGVLVFVRGIIDALQGSQAKVNAYIENNNYGTSYFSGLVTIDSHGACAMDEYNNISSYESLMLEQSIEQLSKDVALGKRILELT